MFAFSFDRAMMGKAKGARGVSQMAFFFPKTIAPLL